MPLSCSSRTTFNADTSAVFIFVQPKGIACQIHPSDGAPSVECAKGGELVNKVIDAYPTIDWDLPTEVCVVDLGAGRILDVFFNGRWGSMRRDEFGVVR